MITGIAVLGVIAVLAIFTFNYAPGSNSSQTHAAAATFVPPHPIVLQIGTTTVPVSARGYSYFSFKVLPSMSQVYLSGSFRASGGSNDIQAFLVDEDGFINFANGNQFRAYYHSGTVTIDNVNVGPLAPGTYYLIYSNRFALMTDKLVDNHIALHFLAE